MRIAVVDIGTNSTRLLIADVENGRVKTLDMDPIVHEHNRWAAKLAAQH